MKKEIAKLFLLFCVAVIGLAILLFILRADTSQASPQYIWGATGMGEKPAGQLVAGSCFTLTFSIPRAWVIINNQTGADAYYVPNDPGCAAGSSYFDHVLDDGEDAFYNGWLKFEWVTVYITPTAGFTVTGW